MAPPKPRFVVVNAPAVVVVLAPNKPKADEVVVAPKFKPPPRPPRPALAVVVEPKDRPVDAAVLVPAPKLRPPLRPGVKDVVVPNAGVVVVAPNAGVELVPNESDVLAPKAGALVVAPNDVDAAPKAGPLVAPNAGAVDVAPKAGAVDVAPKAGAVDVAPKLDPNDGVPVPNAGADVAGVPNRPVEGWEVAVKPNPGVAGLLAPKLKPVDKPVVAGALDGVPKEKDIFVIVYSYAVK